MEEVSKMIAEKRAKLKEEIEELRTMVSKLQKDIANKEKELIAMNQAEQSLGIKAQPESSQEGEKSQYDEKERARRYYVIYNGPGRGVYDDWRKASLFVTGVSGVVHKKFLSKKEAQDSLDAENKKEATKEVKTYSAKLQSPATTVAKKMINLGKIPTPKTIDSILTKQQLQEQKRLTKKVFYEEFKFLMNYSDEDKITSIYPVESRALGPKAVVLPEADPIKTFMLYQCGFIDTIYFQGGEIFRYFPEKMKKAIQVYISRILGKREGFLKIISTTPEFDDKDEVSQPAIQLCHIGASNSNYPVIGTIHEDNESRWFLNNYILILDKGVKIKGRINYSAKSTIVWSLQAKQPAEQDEQLLREFLYRVLRNEFGYSEEVRKAICLTLQKEFTEDHICKECEKVAAEIEIVKEED